MPKIRVFVEDILYFNNEIFIDPDRALVLVESAPQRLADAIRAAKDHIGDWPLVEACSGGRGPLANAGDIFFDEYLSRLESIVIDEAVSVSGAYAKKRATAERRSEFNKIRNDLLLAMLNAGTPYVCAHEGCIVHENLTIDHVKALSRGGTDDLSNLQFLCHRHNCEKSDK